MKTNWRNTSYENRCPECRMTLRAEVENRVRLAIQQGDSKAAYRIACETLYMWR